VLTTQLQQTLGSRVVIEQATGIVTRTPARGVDEVFTLLDDHARSHNQLLSSRLWP